MKAKFGAIVVAGSGKIGGHVASRNRAGAYIRTKVTPVNPSTSAQLTVRQRLTNFSQAWRGLTEAQRAAWNAAVGAYARTDVFGDLKNPTGFNLYQRLNNNLNAVGQAALTLPPIVDEVLTVNFTALAGAAGASTLALTLSGAVPAGTSMKVFATPGVSPGISFVKSEYRLIAVEAPAAASPVAEGADWETKFGDLVAGQKVFVKVVFVNNTTGQESNAQQLSTIVAA
jgi:hypothetical protein